MIEHEDAKGLAWILEGKATRLTLEITLQNKERAQILLGDIQTLTNVLKAFLKESEKNGSEQ